MDSKIYTCICPICAEKIDLIYNSKFKFKCPVCNTPVKVSINYNKTIQDKSYFLQMLKES